jgi:hypothetical protein
MNLPWLKLKTASLAELQQQAGEARAAHQQSIEAVAAAQTEFDEDPSKLRGLLDAQQGERAALAHVDRAARLLADAQAKSDAERRSQLERRATELREKLSHQQLLQLRAPTRTAEIEALKTAIDARAKRVVVEEQISKLSRELQQVRVQLGEPEESVYAANLTPIYDLPMPSTVGIGDDLMDEFRRLGSDDFRMRCVSAMRDYLRALR